jgi:hypothetical protein
METDMGWRNHVPKELHDVEHHIHHDSLVVPDGAVPVTLTCGTAAAWTWGSWVEMVSAGSAPDEEFDFHWLLLRDISANSDYEIQIGAGGAGSEVVQTTLTAFKSAGFSQEGSLSIMCPQIPAGTRVAARVRSASGNADTVGIKLTGHKYHAQ